MMNNLSWLLYFADVIPSLGSCLQFFGVSFLVIIGVTVFIGSLALEEFYWKTYHVWLSVAAPLLLLVGCFLPSKETIYMIAASEAGEQALKTPEFSKLRTLINETLDRGISEVKGKDTDKEGNSE